MRHLATILTASVTVCSISAIAVPPGGSPPDGSTDGGRGTSITNSVITNVGKNITTNASDGSTVNTGIQAQQATIKNSTISNQSTGTIDAKNSTVNTGIIIQKGGAVQDSRLIKKSDANVKAVNSNVNAGGMLIENATNATATSDTKTDITATNSNVDVLSVSGDVSNAKINVEGHLSVDACNQNVQIGTVRGPSSLGGQDYRQNNRGSLSGDSGSAPTSIGNVTMDGTTPKNVNIATTSGTSVTREIKAEANVAVNKGGPDASGTITKIITKDEYDKAMQNGGSPGNVDLNDPSKRAANILIKNK